MKIYATSQYNQNFKGFKLNKHQNTQLCEQAANILQQNYKELSTLTQGASRKQLQFFDELVQLYNARNFYRQTNKEDSTLVNAIYKNVRTPKKLHFDLVTHFQDSLENLNQIFTLGNSPKKLRFIKNVKNLIENSSNDYNSNLITDLLNSKYLNFYANNFKKLKSYLILNKNNSNGIKNLDKMIENKTFNHNEYDKQLKIKNIIENINTDDSTRLDSRVFIENYSNSKINVLQDITNNFINLNKRIDKNEINEILEMYLTTNNKNVKQRLQVIKYFSNTNNSNLKNAKRLDFLKELNELFNTLDNGDKHSKNYLKKVVSKQNHLFETPSEITEILTNISSKKLNIFADNSKKIISNFSREERLYVLKKELDNPFYSISKFKEKYKFAIKYGYKKLPNNFQKAYIYTKNIFNIIRDKLTRDTEPIKIKTKELPTVTIKPEVPNVAKPIRTEEKTFANKIMKESYTDNKKSKEENQVLDEEAIFKKITSNVIKLQQKQALIKNLISVLSKKLGTKTLANQREQFVENATKMRYEMLPEIFASISDTRKADRAVGKYRINSANKDALNLYLKINGNNKKFVNYLLKKRNVDGSRMFEVKDIISMLDKAEQQIKKQRENNPEYRARDVRKYYNHLLESKIEQYGKVTRQKSKKTK